MDEHGSQALLKCGVKSLYYECKQVAQESNVEGLSGILSETMDLPKLGFSDIESLLDYIFELSSKEKLVLVLDEYPYLRESVKGEEHGPGIWIWKRR